MAHTQEPFSIFKIECPVCGTINECPDIRPMSFRETGSDTDFCPLGLVWANAAYQAHDPLWYFMCTCAKCFYTREVTPEFTGWARDDNFKTYRQAKIREKHLAAAADQNGIVQFLGSHLDPKSHPAESAIIKFLLGIYDEVTTDRTSSLNLARYFLRIAWLFRGREKPVDAQDPAGAALKRMRAMLSDLDHALRAYEQKVAAVTAAFERDAAAVVKDMSASIAALQRSHAQLAAASDTVEQAGPEASSGSAFYTFASFDQFLRKARELWNDVPLNEQDALLRARDYYKQAYETGSEVKEGVGQVQVAYLIAELSRRTGDVATAEQYFNTMLKVGGHLASSRTETAATVNRTKKLLELGREQARLNKEAQAAGGRDGR